MNSKLLEQKTEKHEIQMLRFALCHLLYVVVVCRRL